MLPREKIPIKRTIYIAKGNQNIRSCEKNATVSGKTKFGVSAKVIWTSFRYFFNLISPT